MEELNIKTHCSFQRQNWIPRLKIPWNLPDIRLNTSSPVLDPHIELCWMKVLQALSKTTLKDGSRRDPPASSRSENRKSSTCNLVTDLLQSSWAQLWHCTWAAAWGQDRGRRLGGSCCWATSCQNPTLALLQHSLSLSERRSEPTSRSGRQPFKCSARFAGHKNQTFQRRKIFTPEIAGHLGGCHPKRTRHWPYRPA